MAILYFLMDSANESVKSDIENYLKKPDFQEVDIPKEALLLIVHASTNAPGRTEGVAVEDVNAVLKRGGLFIQYTTAWEDRWKWQVEDRNYDGHYLCMLDRLKSLQSPVTLQIFKESLDRSNSMSLTISLAVFCRTFLAAHDGDSLEGWDRVPDEYRKKAKLQKDNLSQPDWWHNSVFEVFNQRDSEWKKTLEYEVEELAKNHSLSKQAKDIKKFVKKPEVNLDNLRTVYQALRDLLRERAGS